MTFPRGELMAVNIPAMKLFVIISEEVLYV